MDKILFILHYPPPVHGSAIVGQYIKESTLINDYFESQFINLGTSVSINEIGKSGIKKILIYLRILLKVFKQLLIFRPDLCYLTITAKGIAFYKDSIIAIIIKIFGIKLIYHFHNKGVTDNQANFINNSLYKLVFKNSNIILLSKFLYTDIKKYIEEDRVYYLQNGIPDSETISTKKNNNIINILFISNLLESKGILILLEALKILKDKSIEFHLNIVGGEGDISENYLLNEISRKDLEYHVSYLGKKIGKDKEDLLNNANIFALPSYNDCLPLVLIEAIQYSLPVVSTFEGGIPDIVEDGINGYLVQQKDIQALADKLEILINNPGLRLKMGANGRKKYLANFTLEKFENNMVNILEKVLQSH